MTLAQLLSANSRTDVMFHLYNKVGDSEAFAIVSAGASSSLSTDVSSKTVTSYTISGPTNVSVYFAAADDGGDDENEGA